MIDVLNRSLDVVDLLNRALNVILQHVQLGRLLPLKVVYKLYS